MIWNVTVNQGFKSVHYTLSFDPDGIYRQCLIGIRFSIWIQAEFYLHYPDCQTVCLECRHWSVYSFLWNKKNQFQPPLSCNPEHRLELGLMSLTIFESVHIPLTWQCFTFCTYNDTMTQLNKVMMYSTYNLSVLPSVFCSFLLPLLFTGLLGCCVFTNFPPQAEVMNPFFPEAEIMNRVNFRTEEKKNPFMPRRVSYTDNKEKKIFCIY